MIAAWDEFLPTMAKGEIARVKCQSLRVFSMFRTVACNAFRSVCHYFRSMRGNGRFLRFFWVRFGKLDIGLGGCERAVQGETCTALWRSEVPCSRAGEFPQSLWTAVRHWDIGFLQSEGTERRIQNLGMEPHLFGFFQHVIQLARIYFLSDIGTKKSDAIEGFVDLCSLKILVWRKCLLWYFGAPIGVGDLVGGHRRFWCVEKGMLSLWHHRRISGQNLYAFEESWT